jgi:hypothetical protein
MSSPLPTYTFLPWLRQGLSNTITQDETTPNANLRASVALQLTLRSQGLSGAVPDANLATNIVRLYGPGDVLGIDQRAIVKTEPRHWITNFEPNNLAHIEFYDEDFPWRYTPAHADVAAHRHRPWITLVVLEEGEFKDGTATGSKTPFIEIADLNKLPVKEELWAWAHVHANRNLGADDTVIVNSDGSALASRLTSVLNENPDLAYSRIICPRKLEPNKAYHAFLIPTFETGRVAGLGLDVSKVDDAMRGAWENHPQRASLSGGNFPYYHRWFFRTGIVGDFEYLVRLLKPRLLDPRVGRRDIDVQRPGSNLNGIAGPKADGVLRLGGALRIPTLALSSADKTEAEKFEAWMDPAPHAFQSDLASFINLADDYAAVTATQAHNAPGVPAEIGVLPDGSTDPDPLITPPLYGTWHAMTKRLLTERNGAAVPNTGNWVHDLNLDPRHRTAAGFGTRVVRERQEEYVSAAWQQVGEVVDANRTLRLYQFGMEVSLSWFARYFEPIRANAPSRFVMLSAPMMSRVVADGFSVRKRVLDSRVPLAVTGVAMRRALRPGSRLMRSIPAAAASDVRAGAIINGLNEGKLVAAAPPTLPNGAATIRAVSKALLPNVPGWLLSALRRYPRLATWVLIIVLVIAIILFALGLGFVAVAALAMAAGAFTWLRAVKKKVDVADSLLPENEVDPAVVDRMPQAPTFAIEPYGVTADVLATGTTDNAAALRFKEALRSSFQLHGDLLRAAPPIRRQAVDVAGLASATSHTIDPGRAMPLRFSRAVRMPSRIRDSMRETFIEAMYYPRIDTPMYRPLADVASELLLPNIGLIPADSLTLLETNQKFIESCMVGINHEFARELLWREYPTDQRGSYFRQFWDVSGYQDLEGLTPDALREKLYDIPKLHRWSRTSTLGSHDNRQPPGTPPRDELVLSIRGELLKRYPTAVIYAHKASWQTTNGVIDKSLIRIPIPLTAPEELQPPREKVKTPLYEARVDPDITFFGFDLTVTQAKGNPDTNDAGWFFVIKERPGEPRFGLDIDRGGAPINSWSDLAWDDVTTQNGNIRINPAMNEYQLTTPPPASEGPDEHAQHKEDKQLSWNRDTNAADVAYVLYQLPVLVAVHAAEMLPKEPPQ